MSAAAILGAASSIFGEGINWAANRQIADQNYRNQLAAWQMTNEYNSPAAQMERFKAAGLNPNLIYSQQNQSLSSAPSLIQPQRQFPYEQIGSLLGSSNLLQTASTEARNWLKTMQQRKESESRIALNSSRSLLNDVQKDLTFLKYSSYKQGDYFGKFVENLAKRNVILKLKSDIDTNTYDFLQRTLDNRIAAIELKNDLMRAQENLAYERSFSEPARRTMWANQAKLWQSQRLLNTYKTGESILDNVWKDSRNKYRSVYWQGKAGQEYNKAILYGDQDELYKARTHYTNVKAGLAPWEFGLDAVQKLGKLGLDAYKTSKMPNYRLRTSNKPLKYY